MDRLSYAFFYILRVNLFDSISNDISGELESDFFVFVFALKPIQKVFESHFELRIESNQEEIRESNRISKLRTCLVKIPWTQQTRAVFDVLYTKLFVSV